jgi:hypothetical protein
MGDADLVGQAVGCGEMIWRQRPDGLARTKPESALSECDTGLLRRDIAVRSHYSLLEVAPVRVDLSTC